MYAKGAAFIVALLSLSLLLSAAGGQLSNTTTGTGGGTSSTGGPTNSACSSACNYSGAVVCDGSYVRTCGNYDSDSCLEWNSTGYCPYGCSEGVCKNVTTGPGGNGGDGGPVWNASDEPGNGLVEAALNFTCAMPKNDTLLELSKVRTWYVTKAEALWQYMGILRGGASGNRVSDSDAKAYMELDQTRLRYLERVAEIGLLMESIEATDCSTGKPHEIPPGNDTSRNETPPSAGNESIPPASNATGGGMDAVRDLYKNDTEIDDSSNMTEQERYELKKREWLGYNSTEEFREAAGQSYVNVAASKSPESDKAVANIPDVSQDDVVRIDVQGGSGMPVRTVEISMCKDASASEVRVRGLDSNPKPVAASPSARDVYTYVEIEKGMKDDAIKDVSIGFAVKKEWLSEKNINTTERIVLYRYAGGSWGELPTRWLGEDDGNVYYESFSPGLSFFVIGITAAATSPIQIELPSDTAGADDDIARIKFDWVFVALVAAVVLVIAVLKFTPLSKKLSGKMNREKPQELQDRLSELKAEREEALNRYYKREITEQQMTAIVNDKKKQEFDIEMRLKRIQSKESGKAQKEKPPTAAPPQS